MNIGDMFEMQLLLNTELSNVSTAIESAANTAVSSMARNVKG